MASPPCRVYKTTKKDFRSHRIRFKSPIDKKGDGIDRVLRGFDIAKNCWGVARRQKRMTLRTAVIDVRESCGCKCVPAVYKVVIQVENYGI